MQRRWLVLGAALWCGAVGAKAQTAAPPAAAPTPEVTFTGGATLVTDYRFRGLSQTDDGIAVQATGTITHKSGLYASFWGSSIDDYIANGSDAELDLIAGYKHAFHGTTVDGGVLYYVYPGNNGANTDFFEPYLNVSHSYGPLSAKVGANVSWKQTALGLTGERRAGTYVYGELSAAIPKTPIAITGHLGHSFKSNYITFGEHYTDWSVAGTYTFRSITLGVAYIDTDTRDYSYPNGGGRNRNVARSGIIGSIGFAF